MICNVYKPDDSQYGQDYHLLIAFRKIKCQALDLVFPLYNIRKHTRNLPLIQLRLIKAKVELAYWIEFKLKLHAELLCAIFV